MACDFSLKVRELMKVIMIMVVLLVNHSSAETLPQAADDRSTFQCPGGIFSFGTSLSDTGISGFAFPSVFNSEKPPYGQTFFGRNAYRFSDGRLVVDFYAQAFGFPLLAPYFQSILGDFRRGVNFATSGATGIAESPQVPFFAAAQVLQFLRFKQTTIAARQLPAPLSHDLRLPNITTFDNGLYVISFGRNDLTDAYLLQGYTPKNATEILVPQIVQSVVQAIQVLYNNGAKSFMVFNVNPQGCSPQYLTNFGDSANAQDFDKFGCLTPYNEAIQVYNAQLFTAVKDLREILKGSTILYFDYFQAAIAVLEQPEAFGFAANKTLQACCGTDGKYNYNATLSCSKTTSVNNVSVSVGVCSHPDKYINWDGIHFTDAYNRAIAEFSLSGKFLDPPLNLESKCNLDFSKFRGVNFTEAYPNGYLLTPGMQTGSDFHQAFVRQTFKLPPYLT